CAAGRSYGQKTAQLRAALLDVVGPKTLKRIARKLVNLAEQGDLGAAKLLLAYTIGKPTEAADPDELPRRQWERLTLTGRINALYSLRHAIDPQRTLEVLAGLLGYERPEDFSAVLFAPRDPTLEAQVNRTLAGLRQEAGGDPQNRLIGELQDAVIREWKPRLNSLLCSLDKNLDQRTPAEVLEAADVIWCILKKLSDAGALNHHDPFLAFLAAKLRRLAETGRSAATTADHAELLDGLQKVVPD